MNFKCWITSDWYPKGRASYRAEVIPYEDQDQNLKKKTDSVKAENHQYSLVRAQCRNKTGVPRNHAEIVTH